MVLDKFWEPTRAFESSATFDLFKSCWSFLTSKIQALFTLFIFARQIQVSYFSLVSAPAPSVEFTRIRNTCMRPGETRWASVFRMYSYIQKTAVAFQIVDYSKRKKTTPNPDLASSQLLLLKQQCCRSHIVAFGGSMKSRQTRATFDLFVVIQQSYYGVMVQLSGHWQRCEPILDVTTTKTKFSICNNINNFFIYSFVANLSG